ncbi:MAG: hypothetical protein KKF67_04055 [Nanoarchaeota archaeon]|nr:hypothetical protein [Nanoarchaeota archaeon]
MKIKEIIFGIAIIVLMIFVSVYGISTFLPKPQYEDYCTPVKTAEYIETEARCIEVGGSWGSYGEIRCVTEPCPTGYCDREYYCRQDYDNALEVRSKKVFYVAIPLGVLILLVGGFLFYLESVGAGLMGGGVGTIIYGAGVYWRYGDDLFRFIISLLGLGAVIYLTYWFNRKDKRRFLFWKK